jgi:ElaB/YqjD/DUF883 family membrane-anchored ribosome-binding protein
MEVYYKELISQEASLEKLVDDLAMVVQGTDLPQPRKEAINTRLTGLRERCSRLKQQAMAGARATDQFVRSNPYSTLGTAFALGIVAGVLLCRKR